MTYAAIKVQVVTADCGFCGHTICDQKDHSILIKTGEWNDVTATITCGVCGTPNRLPRAAFVETMTTLRRQANG